jgi:TIGR01777 family protein
MNILVSGGTGFIGSALCKRLLRDGNAVTVLTRDRERADRHFESKVRAIEAMHELTPDCAPEIIANLAGKSLGSGRWTEALKKTFITSRVGTTKRLTNYIAGAEIKPRVLISGSAVGYYGDRGDAVLIENDAPGNEYQADLCKAWETAALEAEAHGVRVCLLRSGVVLGKGGGALSTLIPQFKLGLGGSVGSGRQWMSWIHINDLISIILHLISHETLIGAFNCTTPNPESNRDFAAKLAAQLRRPAVLRVPQWVLRILVGEVAHLYVTGQKVIPQKLLESGYQFKYPELSMALEEILG